MFFSAGEMPVFAEIHPAAAPIAGGALLCLTNRSALPPVDRDAGPPIVHFLGRERGVLLPEAVPGTWRPRDGKLCVRSPQTRFVGPLAVQVDLGGRAPRLGPLLGRSRRCHCVPCRLK